MSEPAEFRLEGVASPADAARMLDQICEHFVEHAEVERAGDDAVMRSRLGTARLRLRGPRLLIELAAPSEPALQIARTSIAEHMFHFAGDSSLELSWSDATARTRPANLHEVIVVGAEQITPHMRRVRFSCADVGPFIGGDMHVRLLIPPRGRDPVWPGCRPDGRIDWPVGEEAFAVRAYTIRAVDRERGELWIDFLQHPAPGALTPGADFARAARAGDRAALLGPGSGRLPGARSILLIGDESALPAIARIAAEVPADAELRALIEVKDAGEEQPLPCAGRLDLRWLHRDGSQARPAGALLREGIEAIERADRETFVWVACEKDDVRALRAVLRERGHDKASSYAAWYWERSNPDRQPAE